MIVGVKANNIPAALRSFVNDASLVVRSPGRINLIGEHTDYNEGFVLPAAIDKGIYVVVSRNQDDEISLHSVDFNETIETRLGDITPAPGHWSTYILGVVDQLKRRGYAIAGFNLSVYGDVPQGAGLSSSAAVECATAFALNELYGLGIGRKALAAIAQKAEHEYAGVKCGIMDQFASLMGRKEHVIRLDCRSLDHDYFPLRMAGHEIILFDSQVKHALASSAYNQRRSECEQGVRIVQEIFPHVKSLRDVSPAMLQEAVDPNHIIYNRCRFVIEENERVVMGCDDLARGDLQAFGKKMFASHEGLKNLYDVSCRELDTLVSSAASVPFVIGARMMGGGFGGCTINMIKKEKVTEVVETVSRQYYQQAQKELKTYIVRIENGTAVVNS